MLDINWQRVRAVYDKEMADLRHHKFIVYSMISLPIILLLCTVGTIAAASFSPDSKIDPSLTKYLPPELAAIPQAMAILVLVNDQLLFYYLIIPAMLPIVIAVNSVIGEKEIKSLEPLLATPISTTELLLGKSLAATIIPVVSTWACYLLTVVAGFFLAPQPVFRFLARPAWILGMGVMSPLLAFIAVLIGVLISSRVNDTRLAQQLGGMLVLPIVGGATVALLGKLFLNVIHVAMSTVMLLFMSLVVFVIAIELFERETILTRWK